MPDSPTRPAPLKPLTLPRSLSRILSRLIAMPPGESLPLAKTVYENAPSPRQRSLALRLRLRLLQEALDAAQTPAKAAPEPKAEIIEAPAEEPVPEPEPEKAPAKTGKLVSMDLEGGALEMMMQGLGGGEDEEEEGDEFFSKS